MTIDTLSFLRRESNNLEHETNFKKYLMGCADIIYSKVLLGENASLLNAIEKRFLETINKATFFGDYKEGTKETSLSPHLSAYVLGAVNLLESKGYQIRDSLLSSINLDVSLLIDEKNLLPIWPKLYSHHVWRVSHWIGGIPSILLTFERHDPRKRLQNNYVKEILKNCDNKLLDRKKGFLLPYKSKSLNFVFRNMYRLRHDPDLAEIGGLVHVHWINYLTERDYLNNEGLLELCLATVVNKPLFLEEAPYCLDFDYVQFIRTAFERSPRLDKETFYPRMKKYFVDLNDFLDEIPENGYSLHKLPGTLAALHEIALFLELDNISSLECKPIDIIKEAYWL